MSICFNGFQFSKVWNTNCFISLSYEFNFLVNYENQFLWNGLKISDFSFFSDGKKGWIHEFSMYYSQRDNKEEWIKANTPLCSMFSWPVSISHYAYMKHFIIPGNCSHFLVLLAFLQKRLISEWLRTCFKSYSQIYIICFWHIFKKLFAKFQSLYFYSLPHDYFGYFYSQNKSSVE